MNTRYRMYISPPGLCVALPGNKAEMDSHRAQNSGPILLILHLTTRLLERVTPVLCMCVHTVCEIVCVRLTKCACVSTECGGIGLYNKWMCVACARACCGRHVGDVRRCGADEGHVWEKEGSDSEKVSWSGFIMGHSRGQALALIDLWVMRRAQPRGPLEGSLGCKYNSVFLLHTRDRDTDKGGSDRRRGTGGKEITCLFLSFTFWSFLSVLLTV